MYDGRLKRKEVKGKRVVVVVVSWNVEVWWKEVSCENDEGKVGGVV